MIGVAISDEVRVDLGAVCELFSAGEDPHRHLVLTHAHRVAHDLAEVLDPNRRLGVVDRRFAVGPGHKRIVRLHGPQAGVMADQPPHRGRARAPDVAQAAGDLSPALRREVVDRAADELRRLVSQPAIRRRLQHKVNVFEERHRAQRSVPSLQALHGFKQPCLLRGVEHADRMQHRPAALPRVIQPLACRVRITDEQLLNVCFCLRLTSVECRKRLADFARDVPHRLEFHGDHRLRKCEPV